MLVPGNVLFTEVYVLYWLVFTRNTNIIIENNYTVYINIQVCTGTGACIKLCNISLWSCEQVCS